LNPGTNATPEISSPSPPQKEERAGVAPRFMGRILIFGEASAKESRHGGMTEPTKPKIKKTALSIPFAEWLVLF